MTKRYAKLIETVLGFLLAFPNCYMVEAVFCHIDDLLTKQRSKLDMGERGDLRLILTYLQPNIHTLIQDHQLHPSH